MSYFPRFTSFDEDPFFEGHRERMRDFERISGSSSFPFGSPSTQRQSQDPQPLPSTSTQADRTVQPSGSLFPAFEPCSNLINQMNSMVRRFDDIANRMTNPAIFNQPNNPDSHSFTQSSVYSYRNTGEGEPHVYEAHHSKRTAPGGIREEKKALRDTSKNLEKYSVGRHINDRGHVTEKTTNTNTNETQQRENLYGLQHSDVEQFKSDWHNVTSSFGNTWASLDQQPKVEQKAVKGSTDKQGSKL